MRKAVWLLLGASLVPGFLQSCDNRRQSADHEFEVQLMDGIPVAVNSLGPAYDSPPLAFEKLLEPIQDPSVPQSLVGWAQEVSIDESGSIYVFDYQQRSILVFDSAGGFSHVIGRAGEGPGEFGAIEIQSTANGVVTTWDRDQRRLTQFTADGELMEVHSLAQFAVGTWFADYSSIGGLIVYRSESLPPRDEYYYRRGHLMFLGADGDTLAEYFTDGIPTMHAAERQGAWSALPFSGAPVFAPTPDGHFFFGNGDQPVLDKYDEAGRHVGRIVVQAPREPVSDQERAAIIDEYQERIDQADGPAKTRAQQSLEALRIPDTKAFWNSLYVDDKGYIWLRIPESQRVMSDKPGSICRLLSPAGEYLGDLEVPADSFRIANNRLVALAWASSEELPVLAVYRIAPAVPGMDYR